MASVMRANGVKINKFDFTKLVMRIMMIVCSLVGQSLLLSRENIQLRHGHEITNIDAHTHTTALGGCIALRHRRQNAGRG